MDSEVISSALKVIPSLQYITSSPPPISASCQDEEKEFANVSNTNDESETIDRKAEDHGDEYISSTYSNDSLNKEVSSNQNSPLHCALSPPPLDCIMSSSFDDSLDIVSPSHQNYIDEDDEFGDFISNDIESKNCDNVQNENEINSIDITPFREKSISDSNILPIDANIEDISFCEGFVPNNKHMSCQSEGECSLDSFGEFQESSFLNDRQSENAITNDLQISNSIINSNEGFSCNSPMEANITCQQIELPENTFKQHADFSIQKESLEIIDEKDTTVSDTDYDDFVNFASFPDPQKMHDIDSSDDFTDFQDVNYDNENLSSKDKEANCDIDKIRNLDWLDDETINEDFGSFHYEVTNKSTSDTGDSISRKFDALILRWTPKLQNDGISEDSMKKLKDVIDGDAFIWHHLEDIDSSLALKMSWSNSQMHSFFLRTLDVDARNILFGQKWSSSVPLFAQTLTFSPLKPARSSALEQGQSKLTPKMTTVTPDSTQEMEKVIPPVQFDWSSSGLINPLETPGIEEEIFSSPNVSNKNEKSEISKGSSSFMEKILKNNLTQDPPPIESLSMDVKEVVKSLPSLSFMKSKVLMFPLLSDSKK